MARIVTTMQATGIVSAGEQCNGCGRLFIRGETMTAVEYDDGESAGWFCRRCIDNWNTTIAKGVAITPQVFQCPCGWSGTIEAMDALGSAAGCCPVCGNEDFGEQDSG